MLFTIHRFCSIIKSEFEKNIDFLQKNKIEGVE